MKAALSFAPAKAYFTSGGQQPAIVAGGYSGYDRGLAWTNLTLQRRHRDQLGCGFAEQLSVTCCIAA